MKREERMVFIVENRVVQRTSLLNPPPPYYLQRLQRSFHWVLTLLLLRLGPTTRYRFGIESQAWPQPIFHMCQVPI
jgi:hypothetical protein